MLTDFVKNSPAWPFTLCEDCRTLHVVRPTGTNACSAIPVGVFLHGGAWTMDYSANGVYNLSFMVNQSVAMKKPIVAASHDCELLLSKP
jgi:carboxylesterase type B